MERRIIIVVGNADNTLQKESFIKFSKYYSAYFGSNVGGAYEINEISILIEPRSNEIVNFTRELNVDFCVCIFIGHGATQDDNQLFKLNRDEIIKIGQLDIPTKKQLIIVESCRSNIENVPNVDLNDKIPLFEDGGKIRSPKDRTVSKDIYNRIIEDSSNGITICLACNIGEEANNFYFSSVFLTIAFDWSQDSQIYDRILFVDELMYVTKKEVAKLAKEELNTSQNPEIRSGVNFPIGVSKY